MARRRKYYESYSVEELISYVGLFYVIYVIYLWFTNKTSFVNWVIGGLLVLLLICTLLVLWNRFISGIKKNKIEGLIASVRKAGAEEDINNFINSFGYQKKTGKNLWKNEEFSFTWEQLDIFRKALHDKGVQLSLHDYNDISLLLRHYIYEKKDRFIRESISHRPKNFNALTGIEFENLLCRLYEAMGYSVMKTGKVGDQGCDLVVNMGQQRVVVQAKCFRSSIGNDAVQQALGALKIYNCSKAIVVTNSYFTQEAIQLASVNNIELINGIRLRELLTQFLKENWS